MPVFVKTSYFVIGREFSLPGIAIDVCCRYLPVFAFTFSESRHWPQHLRPPWAPPKALPVYLGPCPGTETRDCVFSEWGTWGLGPGAQESVKVSDASGLGLSGGDVDKIWNVKKAFSGFEMKGLLWRRVRCLAGF